MSRSAALLQAVSSLSLSQVWRASDLERSNEKVLSCGHAVLDAQLPGGGWPIGHLVEILQARPHQHAWQLLLPALSQALKQEAGPVVLVGAPFEPFGPSLCAQGVPCQRLLKVQSGKPAAQLWAAEQALRCAEVAAVVAWLPKANSSELRRLHMAAQQHGRLLFVFRTQQSTHQATPARLQILVEGTQDMQVRILKRRGPPLLQPVRLPAHPPRLSALLQSRKRRAGAVVTIQPGGRSHVLDRTAAHA